MLRKALETKRRIIESLNQKLDERSIIKENERYIIKENLSEREALKVARQLHDSMKGAGTDEDAFWRITKKYASCCSMEIREAFKEAFGGTASWPSTSSEKGDLRKWIEGDFTKEQPWWNAGISNDASGEGRESALKAWGYTN